MMSKSKTASSQNKLIHAKIAAAFQRVIDSHVGDSEVTYADGKGFASKALKVGGKIFAMITSKEVFVVKLPKMRADELVRSGEAEYFDPGHGRLMKEWIVILKDSSAWVAIAIEARTYIGSGKG